jgi:pimeloyl-ACP methyl ester carboxylesterase
MARSVPTGPDRVSRLIDSSYRNAAAVPVPGGRLVVVQQGSGPSALLLHGIPLSLLTWRHTLGPLAAGRHVVAVDLLGYGRSDKPRGADYTLAGQAGAIAELLPALGLSTVDVIGHSYGGAVGMALAAAAPERVGKLVLIDPVCYPGGPHDLERLLRLRLVAAATRPLLRARPVGRRLLAQRLQHCYADRRAVTPELAGATYRLLRTGSGERSYLGSLQALRLVDVAALVPRLAHETLVIWGELDRVLPAGDGERLVGELPAARLEIVPDAGHFPHEEAPDRVNALIGAFLAHPGSYCGPARTPPVEPAPKGPVRC